MKFLPFEPSVITTGSGSTGPASMSTIPSRRTVRGAVLTTISHHGPIHTGIEPTHLRGCPRPPPPSSIGGSSSSPQAEKVASKSKCGQKRNKSKGLEDSGHGISYRYGQGFSAASSPPFS